MKNKNLFDKVINEINNKNKSECCVCFELSNNKTECDHEVCKICIKKINNKCPICRKTFNNLEEERIMNLQSILIEFETYINHHEIPYESIEIIQIGSFNIYGTNDIYNTVIKSHIMNMGTIINITNLLNIMSEFPEISVRINYHRTETVSYIIYTHLLYIILPKIIDYKFTAYAQCGLVYIRMYII